MRLRRVMLAVLMALALAGCSSTEHSTAGNGVNATEQVCAENPSYMENVPECKNMSTSEKEVSRAFAQNQQEKSTASEAESILKKREAESTANAIEGAG